MGNLGTPSASIGRLRAPRGNGELLAVPALTACPALAQSNSDALRAATLRLGGQSLSEFRDFTRRQVLEAAGEFVASLAPPAEVLDQLAQRGDGVLFVTGHQPILAHPGVWAKNVATAMLARHAGGVGLNLVVDNDTAERTSIDLPAGTRDEPRYASTAFDTHAVQQPWEELRLESADIFRDFPRAVRDQMQPWGIRAELWAIWPPVAPYAADSASMVELLTRLRMAMEWRRGLANFELPVSGLSKLPAFHAFVASVVCRSAEFRTIHNAALAEYRTRYKLHSPRHPMPDLEQREGRTELPFWIWRAGEQRRRRLFVQQSERQLLLADESGPIASMPLTGEGSSESQVAEFLAGLSSTFKIRPRALSLTLFARVALADLFIHGIGGAKYDEVTDCIIERFFGIAAPAYGVLTATLYLPLSAFDIPADQVRNLKRDLRDLQYNPHRFASRTQVNSLIEERDRLAIERNAFRKRQRGTLAHELKRQANRERHRRLVEIREQLAASIAPQRAEIESRLAQAQRQAAANRVLKNREFATVLFPAEQLDQLVASIENKVISAANCAARTESL